MSLQRFQVGSPVTVQWHAPENHDSKDWIGIYRLGDNDNQKVTNISSRGRWAPIYKTQYDDCIDRRESFLDIDEQSTQGKLIFSGSLLPWVSGIFECRYHHAGKHNVMAVSKPIEIYLDPSPSKSTESITKELFPYVQCCFPSKLKPNNPDDQFRMMDLEEVIAKRIVYGIKQMYGIEFAWEIVAADGNCTALASRTASAKSVLQKFSKIELA